jgi:kynurenine formamidase
MVARRKYGIALLSLSFLSAWLAIDAHAIAGEPPAGAAALAAKGTTPGSGQTRPESARDDRPPLTKSDIDQWMKELSNWGRWGAGDQLGTVNLITAAKRIEAAALVKAGLAISLAHNDSTEPAVDNAPPFGHKMLTTGADASALFAKDQYVEAYHTLSITHLDALTHMFYGNTLYNGFPRQSVTEAGAQKLSVIQMKDGIFTRAILFDIPRLKGRPYLEPETRIYPEDLDRWAKEAAVTIEPGDVVLIRTGRWARREKLGAWNIDDSSAGLDATCARWLRDHDVAVLGSDVESDALPSGIEGVRMPIHLLTLASMGMPILDNLDLERVSQLAAEQHRWVFLFSFAPEPVPGGTGSPVNPTAIF